MTRRLPLLCELHAHTTWSDGVLTTRELVDLYGGADFDVLAITDHTCRDGDRHLGAGDFAAYLAEIDQEAERAHELYGLVLVPGLELSYDDDDPSRAAHALALGLREFVGVVGGIDDALRDARAAGAALVAAHPYSLEQAKQSRRGTGRFAAEPDWAAEAVDCFELFNRHEVFGWIAGARLPAVANGDFHRREHLATWKTLIPCARDADAVVEHLRHRRPVHLTRLVPGEVRGRAAA